VSHVTDFLSGLPLCEGMSGLEVAAVAAFLEARRFEAGEVVFREGETGNELFIVRSGRIASYAALPDGSRRQVYEFGPGLLFGEMAIIEGEPRTATCSALEPSELFVLDGLDFYRLVWDHPVIGVKLLAAMGRVMSAWLDEASGFLGGLVRWGEAARKRAVIDDLSGLFNRRFLDDTMRTRFASGSGSKPRASLLMLDLDRFRDLNATFGPAAGDAAIASAGAAFGTLARGEEVAARLSGDEFAFFLPGAGPERARELAEELRAAAEGLFLEFRAGPGSKPARASLTASVGFASAPEDAATAEELSAAADKALYRAKEGGRNRVERA